MAALIQGRDVEDGFTEFRRLPRQHGDERMRDTRGVPVVAGKRFRAVVAGVTQVAYDRVDVRLVQPDVEGRSDSQLQAVHNVGAVANAFESGDRVGHQPGGLALVDRKDDAHGILAQRLDQRIHFGGVVAAIPVVDLEADDIARQLVAVETPLCREPKVQVAAAPRRRRRRHAQSQIIVADGAISAELECAHLQITAVTLDVLRQDRQRSGGAHRDRKQRDRGRANRPSQRHRGADRSKLRGRGRSIFSGVRCIISFVT